MELITSFIATILDILLISKGRQPSTNVGAPVAALCFALFGAILGGIHLFIISSMSTGLAAALHIVFFIFATAFVYANRHQLGFPLSKRHALLYGFSLAAGAATVIFLAAP